MEHREKVEQRKEPVVEQVNDKQVEKGKEPVAEQGKDQEEEKGNEQEVEQGKGKKVKKGKEQEMEQGVEQGERASKRVMPNVRRRARDTGQAQLFTVSDAQ